MNGLPNGDHEDPHAHGDPPGGGGLVDDTPSSSSDGASGADSEGTPETNAVSEDEEKGSQEAKKEKEEERDVLLIHDTGFNIKIDAPGIEPFDLPVSSILYRVSDFPSSHENGSTKLHLLHTINVSILAKHVWAYTISCINSS